jgi:hypothetical protein
MSQRKVNSFGSFQDAVKLLREDLPPSCPVLVKRCKMASDDAGDCAKEDGRFIIRVSNTLHDDAAILILFHEWSHALCWESKFMPGDHHVVWGIAYSMVWKTWLANR